MVYTLYLALLRNESAVASVNETTLASINGKWPDYLLGEQVDHFAAIISYESPTVHPKQQQECSESDRVNYDTFGSCLSGF